jgi:putative heme iron utilization protein
MTTRENFPAIGMRQRANMKQHPDPTPPADPSDVAQARRLVQLAHGALSYIAADGFPGISRIALRRDKAGGLMTLISALAPHFAGLKAHPDCALMLGEPGPKGDPLTHPRLMLRARAVFTNPEERPALRDIWLAAHPKAKLYVDFTDFAFVRLTPTSALLNAGFGKARLLSANELLAAE